MAIKLKENRKAASQFNLCAMIESGMKTRRTLNQLPSKKNL